MQHEAIKKFIIKCNIILKFWKSLNYGTKRTMNVYFLWKQLVMSSPRLKENSQVNLRPVC